ncbi:APC family permease [Hyphomicrobium facile]|uniref:Amino acid transporter n=1 Tax=Hyphomicrobium facile TaxID=51670 RepID=A0A1I7NQB8_9HYPH|nr:APC family permease [Hyphomicrobium facile]SFV36815.1 Amino acid transporter [Hyphomicrobium facile]
MSVSTLESPQVSAGNPQAQMKRVITWKDAFWITAGASPWILFSIGAMADTLGTASILVWGISALIGFVQLFLYAELAGVFPNKTGGGSVYASVAWIKYSKLFAPINMGAYWFGTSTSLTVLSSLCGSYIVSAFFQGTSFASFSVTLLDLSSILPGIVLQLNATIITGIVVLLLVFALQHTGILRAAKIQHVIALFALIPLVLIAIVPLFNGTINYANFQPFELKGGVDWFSTEGLTLLAGGLFIAGWSTYGAEQAVSFVSEFKDPHRDNIRAIVSTGAIAFVCYVLLPFTFLGVLGLTALTQPDFVAGYTQQAVAELATISFGNKAAEIVTIVLILALLLSVGTLLAVSSRTLYQGSVDGVFPKFLSRLNGHRAPVAGMWADIVVNAFLMLLGAPLFVLAAGAVSYLLSISMDLIAVRLLRAQYPASERHFRAPDFLVNYGGPALALFNFGLIIFGANTFAPNALFYGLGVIAVVVLMFIYRHYIVDKGEWPEQAKKDLGIAR